MKKRLSDERVSELVWHPTTMLWTDLAALVCEVQERRAAEQPVADAEIEAWHSMWSKRLCSGLELGEDGEMLTTAIALMRRARQQPEQPASSGLLAAADRMVRAAVFATDDSMVGEARDILSAALAAERERQPAPGYATREREDFEAIDGERMRLQSEIANLREQIPLLWQLYHVQDPDRPMFVVALSMQDAVSRWEAHIREENDCDAGDPPQGVTHTCDERDLLLPSELRRKEGR